MEIYDPSRYLHFSQPPCFLPRDALPPTLAVWWLPRLLPSPGESTPVCRGFTKTSSEGPMRKQVLATSMLRAAFPPPVKIHSPSRLALFFLHGFPGSLVTFVIHSYPCMTGAPRPKRPHFFPNPPLFSPHFREILLAIVCSFPTPPTTFISAPLCTGWPFDECARAPT